MLFTAAGYAWNPLAPAYLAAALATFGLGAGVLLYERLTATSRQFFLLTTVTAAWLAPLGLALLAVDEATRHLWLRAAFLADPFTAPAVYRLATGLAGVRRPRFQRAAWLMGGAFAVANLAGPWLVLGLDVVTQQHRLGDGGWLGLLYTLYITAVLVAAVRELARSRQRRPTREERQESILLALAAAISSLTVVDYWTPTEPFRTGVLTPVVILAAVALAALVAARFRVFALMQAFGTDEVLRALSEAILVCDGAGHVRGANPAAQQLLARPLAELAGAPLSTLLADRSSDGSVWRFAPGEVVRDREMALLAAGAEPIPVRVSTEPLMVGSRSVGSVVVARDVRGSVETERALQWALLRYRALYHHHPAIVHEFDTEGWIVSLNPAARRALGLDEDAPLEGIHWRDRTHPDDIPGMERVLARAQDGSAETYEARVQGADGDYREVRGVVVPVRDGERVVGIFGVGLDVTDEVRTQRELDVQRRYFADLFAGSPEGIVLVDAESGRIRRINAEFTRIFGYTAEEALGRELDTLIAPEERGGESHELTRAAGTGGVVRKETVRRRKDGSLVEVSVLARRLDIPGERTQLYGIYRDISDRLETERALREREEELRHAQKLEAVGKLAGGIAHDFNNLLTVINGHARFALEETPRDWPVRTDLEEIEKAGARAASLTQQLLAYSRRQLLHPQVLELGAVVRDIEGMLRRLIGEHIRVRTSLAEAPLQVRVDRGQLEQVLVNLVVNARDAMPDGGTLTLLTDALTLASDDPRLRKWEVPAGRYARIRVTDTGCGMDAATLERAFEPFFTTKPMGKGTGLGLSTVFGIIKQSGGHVALASTPGAGTRCDVFLPLATTPAGAPSAPAARPVNGRPRGSILVVEDEDAVRDLAARVLRREGCTVFTAENGARALQLAEAHAATLDLVLSDLVMPVMGGRELARHLRHRWPDLPVLFMSGYDSDHGTDGEAGFLSKPFTPAALARYVAEGLDAEGLDGESA